MTINREGLEPEQKIEETSYLLGIPQDEARKKITKGTQGGHSKAPVATSTAIA